MRIRHRRGAIVKNIKSGLLSVVVPAYNCENTIKRCIDSVIAQTYYSIEIIIVNDGSEDGTLKICTEMSNLYPNIIVISQKNCGPGKAKEKGVNLANGEYITFIDADDYIDSKAYEECIKQMKSFNIDIIQFGCYEISDSGKILKKTQLKSGTYITKEYCFNYFITQKNVKNYFWNKVYRAELFRNVEWLPLYYSEDFAVLSQLYGNADKTAIISDIFYYYVQLPSSLCNNPFSSKQFDRLKAGEYVLDYTAKLYPNQVSKALLYLVKSSAQIAAKAYASDDLNSFNIAKMKFKQYYREFKMQKNELKLNIYTYMFALSPKFAVKIKKIYTAKFKPS